MKSKKSFFKFAVKEVLRVRLNEPDKFKRTLSKNNENLGRSVLTGVNIEMYINTLISSE